MISNDVMMRVARDAGNDKGNDAMHSLQNLPKSDWERVWVLYPNSYGVVYVEDIHDH